MKVLLLRTLWTITFLTGADMAEPFVNTNVSSPSSGTSSPMSLSIGVRQVPGKVLEFLHETKGNVYIKEGCKDWWDDYDGTQDVLIDEFYGGFRWTYLLNLLDRFPMRVETKGGYVNFAPKRIFITSNRHPSTWYSHEYADVGALMRRIEVCEEIQAFGGSDV